MASVTENEGMMLCRTVEESLPRRTEKDVRQMRKKVTDFYSNRANTGMYSFEKDAQSGLAALWYVAHTIRKQGDFIIGLGLLSLGAAVYYATKYPLNKEVVGCLSVLGILATVMGFWHKSEAGIAEKAASRELMQLENKKIPEMTQSEVRAARRVSLSFTNLVLTAFQPIETSQNDPRLLENRGYKLWKKWYFKKQRIKDE